MVSKVVNAVKEKTEKSTARDTCRHHWRIEEAQGPTSMGVCKLCGMAREFLNTIPADYLVLARDKHVLKLPELPNVKYDDKKSRC